MQLFDKANFILMKLIYNNRQKIPRETIHIFAVSFKLNDTIIDKLIDFKMRIFLIKKH